MMSHVDLCSGIGGFALGFEWAGLSKPVLFCDIEPWSRKILGKHWPDVPIAHDVKELANDPDRFIPRTDPRNTILTSGYPCQPFSVAGKQRGTEDDRHIWPFIAKLLHTKDPLGAFSKMFMVTLPWASTRCLLTWKPKITPQGRLLCQLAPSTPRTDATDSGLWATPRTTDGTGGPRQLDEQGRRISQTNPDLKFGANLADQVKMWPTPRASSAMNDSTQSVENRLEKRGYEGGYQGGRVRNGKVSMDTLDVAVQHTDNQQKTGGQLNPQWVEWLMGYPEGWTDLEG